MTKKEMINWLEDAAGIYAVPIYLIEELQEQAQQGADHKLMLQKIEDDMEAIAEFKNDLEGQIKD